MITRLITFDKEAREKLLTGIKVISKAVGSTLGPKGRNVAIERVYGSPNVIHDGVTVAKEIFLKDRFENMGVQIVREAASSTNDVAGDGTTTATILAEAIASGCLKAIDEGANPMIIRSGIEKGLSVAINYLDKNKKKISTPKEIKQVATISAQNEDIGEIIAQAVGKVGKDGVVTVETGNGRKTTVEYKEGMQFDKGYISGYFVTDEQKMEAMVENPYILITDQNVINVNAQLVPFLDRFVNENKQTSLVIIANSVEGDALKMLVINKLQGNLKTLAIQSPGFGDTRKEMLEDIAILTGGKVISDETGITFDNVKMEDLGRASKVISNKEESIIIGGHGTAEAIEKRCEMLKSKIENETSQFDREKLQQRLSKLTGGVAIINVGANTNVEMREMKERVIDAVNATQAAMDDGIVAGGESALIRAGSAVSLMDNSKLKEDEVTGIKILIEAMLAPFRVLMRNSGYEENEKLAKMFSCKTNEGIDVMDGELKNLIKAGVIDPVKVTKSALKNACSVAIMVMTTNCLIANDPESISKSNTDNL